MLAHSKMVTMLGRIITLGQTEDLFTFYRRLRSAANVNAANPSLGAPDTLCLENPMPSQRSIIDAPKDRLLFW